MRTRRAGKAATGCDTPPRCRPPHASALTPTRTFSHLVRNLRVWDPPPAVGERSRVRAGCSGGAGGGGSAGRRSVRPAAWRPAGPTSCARPSCSKLAVERRERAEERDAEEREARTERRQAAERDLAQFRSTLEDQREKRREANREHDTQLADEIEEAKRRKEPWERVNNLVSGAPPPLTGPRASLGAVPAADRRGQGLGHPNEGHFRHAQGGSRAAGRQPLAAPFLTAPCAPGPADRHPDEAEPCYQLQCGQRRRSVLVGSRAPPLLQPVHAWRRPPRRAHAQAKGAAHALRPGPSDHHHPRAGHRWDVQRGAAGAGALRVAQPAAEPGRVAHVAGRAACRHAPEGVGPGAVSGEGKQSQRPHAATHMQRHRRG